VPQRNEGALEIAIISIISMPSVPAHIKIRPRPDASVMGIAELSVPYFLLPA
jgi:hypothetical protein